MNKWQRIKFQPNIPLGENGEKVTACAAHRQLSKDAAKEGMVLLKNNGLLPFSKGSRLALFGKACFDYVKGGGGSGDVTVDYVVNLHDGLKTLGEYVSLYEELSDFYRKDVDRQYAEGAEPGMTAEPALSEELVKKARAFTDTAVIGICRFSGEGWDRKSSFDEGKQDEEKEEGLLKKSRKLFERGDFYLSDGETAMVESVKKHFDKIVVVLNVGGMVDTSWFVREDKIKSVLMAWQGGMEGGRAAAELLCGIGNPSGKLSDTFAEALEDYPSTAAFHDSESCVDYTEDIYVGYRYFETMPGAAEKVNYPFGYGLSYTSFQIDQGEAFGEDGTYTLPVTVTNTGKKEGKEVVQIYGQAPQGKLGKPARVLIAFEKTRELKPGESQVLSVDFSIDTLASYDDLGKVCKSAYVLEEGDYVFYAGNSVRDAEKLDLVCHLESPKVVRQLSEQLSPTGLKERMCADGAMETLPTKTGNDPNAILVEKTPVEKLDGYMPAVRAQEGRNCWTNPYKQGVRPLMDVAEGKMTLDEFTAQLTEEELAHLLGGQPNTGVANTFGFGNLPEYGIPNVMTADGPAGLRIVPECGVHTTAWPCATLLACTFNPELVFEVGEAGAKEVKENNIGVWLTPAVNIHRSPLCGRNFEYYSEDPYLTGVMAAAMVKGIQSQHIAACVKHFACNNKETNRRDSDSRVSERALREIYLKAFEIIVKTADPWCIMSSYNIINGHRASECRALLEDILRGEWGYQGMVTTDWWTLGEHCKEVKAGNDMKMACGVPENLLKGLKSGALSREEMEVCVKRILGLILKMD